MKKTNQPKLWKSNRNPRDEEQDQEQSRNKTRIELCKRTWNISQKHIKENFTTTKWINPNLKNQNERNEGEEEEDVVAVQSKKKEGRRRRLLLVV
jgi:hypothetical protein